MRIKKQLLANLFLAFSAATLIVLCAPLEIFQRLQLSFLDSAFRLRQEVPARSPVVIVEITDEDISRVGRWPWDRSWHAAMVRTLSDLGARSIYYDTVLSEASNEEADSLLEEAMRQAGNVYLPLVFQGNIVDERALIRPLPRFEAVLKGTGVINIYPDTDGTIRRIPLIFHAPQKDYEHISLRLARDYALIDPDSALLINWLGRWERTFKRYRFLEVLNAYQQQRDGLAPEIDLGVFRNSVCLVGVTAIGLYDIKPVPLQAEYPSIGIIATGIDNLIRSGVLRTLPFWLVMFLVYVLAGIPALSIRGEKPFLETEVVALAGVLYFFLSVQFFKKNVYLDLFYPLAGLLASYLIVATVTFIRIALERKKFFAMAVTDGLTGLYNIEYFKMLLAAEIYLAQPDPLRRFSLVMADIDYFKKFNDQYGHQTGDLVLKEVALALKSAIRVSDIIARYGGEEIIVLLRGAGFKEASIIASKMRKSVEDRVVREGNKSYRVTVSVGFSLYHQGDTAENLIRRADQAMYKAKEIGRNRVCSLEHAAV